MKIWGLTKALGSGCFLWIGIFFSLLLFFSCRILKRSSTVSSLSLPLLSIWWHRKSFKTISVFWLSPVELWWVWEFTFTLYKWKCCKFWGFLIKATNTFHNWKAVKLDGWLLSLWFYVSNYCTEIFVFNIYLAKMFFRKWDHN